MSEAFEPRNELEQQLMDAQEGRISGEAFMRALMEAQVFMPVLDRSTAGVQLTTKLQPLTLPTEEDSEVLVVFTSSERAKPFVRDPGYEGGILEQFNAILEKVGLGFGMALNPGWDIGLDLEPEMVRQLASNGQSEND
jgi:hypothetical protein